MIPPDRHVLRGLDKTLVPFGEFFEVHVSRSFPLRNNVVFLQHKYLVKKFRHQMFPRQTGCTARARRYAAAASVVHRYSHALPKAFLAKIGIYHASPLHLRSEEHTSELQSLMLISYAVFCLKKKNK